MTRFTRTDAVAALVVAGTVVYTVAVYRHLPAVLPTHFDLHGRADGFSSRSVGAWLLPGSAVALWALLRFGALLLPAGWRDRFQRSQTSGLALVLVALLCGRQVLMLRGALHGAHTAGLPFVLLLAAAWIGLGQLLPRVRRNPFVGIRSAWTLTSDENWARTQRVGAWAFTLAGLVACLAALAHWPAVAIAAIVLSALVPFFYSWVIAYHGT